MMARYVVPLFLAALLVAYLSVSLQQPEQSYYNMTEGWVSIDNPNTLDVLFPGQKLVITPKGEADEEFCLSEYQPWSSLTSVDLKERCYDLDNKVYGACDQESDIRIADGYIEFMNGAEISRKHMMHEITGWSENDFSLCSVTPTAEIYRIDYRTPMEYGKNLFLCIKTGGGFFSTGFMFSQGMIHFKGEQTPTSWRCEGPGRPATVLADDLTEGLHQLAFRVGERHSTYSVYKTERPFSIIYNPNQYKRVMYGEDTVTINNQTLYGYFVLKSEYSDDIGVIWYRCDNSSWQIQNTSQRYSEIIINSTLCEGEGLHRIFYKIEHDGMMGEERYFSFIMHTRRPVLDSVSLFADHSSYRIEARSGSSGEQGVTRIICKWYVNGNPYGVDESLYLPGISVDNGDLIEAACYPLDTFGLSGDPVYPEPLILDIPPSASGIRISPEPLYPDSGISVTSDYVGVDEEGNSLYKWYVNGELASQEKTFSPDGTNPGDEITVEYTPVDIGGLAGTPVSTAFTLPSEDYYYFSKAVLDYNISWCQQISDIRESQRCSDGVDFGSVECADRRNRERFFCMAFLMEDPGYCRYIDLDWYRANCVILTGGVPADCLNLSDSSRDFCIIEFASSRGDPDLCDDIGDHDMNTFCISVANREPESCYSISDSALRERCRRDSSYS
jgi:hypothetical protein